MRKYYAGIGSRSTPADVLLTMQKLSRRLESEGWVLRSGGAAGADSAFESGVRDSDNKQIFLPSRYFNGRSDNDPGMVNSSSLPSWEGALETVDKFHPAPGNLTDFARKLMARNAMQVLGSDLETPSSFILCYTPRGEVTGGTGQALRMAQNYQIPVVNLGSSSTYESLSEWLLTKIRFTDFLKTLFNQ